jgi:hypothetical protein
MAGERLVAFGAVTAGWLLLAAPWLFGGQVIPYDAANYYYPVFRFFAATLGAGESPAWNPYLLAGHPAIADPQSWYFVPTARLYALFDAAPSLSAFSIWQIAHLLGGGMGMLLLARRLGLSWTAAALGALVFMGGGQALGRLQHSYMTIGYAWLPWTLWALECCFHGPRRWRPWRAAGFALLAAAMAVNRDHVAYLNCLLLIGLAAWRIGARLPRRPRLGARAVVHLLPALPVGLLLLAAPVLLTLEFVALSNRPEIGLTVAEHASLQPRAFLGLVAPDFFGAISGAYWGPGRLPWMPLSATGFDWTDESISQLYIGALPLLLLFAAPWRARRFAPYAAGAVFMLLYALGGHTPAFEGLHAWLPGVDLFRRPADAAFPLNLLLALFAAAGFERWRQGHGVARWPLLAASTLATGAGVWLALRLGHGATALLSSAWAATWLVAAAAALWLARRWPAGAVAALALVAVDLHRHGAGLTHNAQDGATVTAYAEDSALAARLRDAVRDEGLWRVEVFGLGGAWQCAPLVHRFEQTLGYSPLRLDAYEAATGAWQNSHTMDRRARFARYDQEIPRRLGIRLVATGEPLANAERLGLVSRGKVGEAWLYENPAALPRAVAEPGSARVLRRTTTDIEIEATMSAAGRLVLHGLYYPGWTATVDGRAAPVERVHGLFRAVTLPPGVHRVTFAFRPLSWPR